MSDDIAIKVDNVSKSFKLPHEKHGSIKNAVLNMFTKRTYENQQVLENVSFEIKKGEFFGIVGRNGSGKSTLLKMLAGIYSPDFGSVQVNGKLTPFIELGVGFSPELTGRENVYLNGSLLGFNRSEMDKMYGEIVEFAELEKFMDQKLKNYSSGMQVRLAFSIAIRAQSDILLIDEVLAVGDMAFQKKCFEYFVLLKQQKKTVVLVTHDMSAVERFCEKAIVIHDGKMIGQFSASEAATEYDRLNSPKESAPTATKSRWGSGKVKIKKVSLESSGKKSQLFETGHEFEIKLDLQNTKKLPVVVGLSFEDMYGVTVAGPNSIGHDFSLPHITYKIDKLPLLPGDYKLTVVVFDKDVVEEYDHMEKSVTFSVTSKRHGLYGKVELPGVWVDSKL